MGPGLGKQSSSTSSNIGNQLEMLAGSAIATGALTAAVARASNSRNTRSGRLRSNLP